MIRDSLKRQLARAAAWMLAASLPLGRLAVALAAALVLGGCPHHH